MCGGLPEEDIGFVIDKRAYTFVVLRFPCCYPLLFAGSFGITFGSRIGKRDVSLSREVADMVSFIPFVCNLMEPRSVLAKH